MDNRDLDKLDRATFLPLLKEALRPMSMCLALVVRSGDERLMADICKVLSSIVQESLTQFELYNHHEGPLQ